ncbi:MAG: outer membrane beta-barrel protein [Vicinamibacterales bacterium]
MRIDRVVVLCAVCAWLAPVPARAEWFVSPFIGAAFAGRVPDGRKLDYGGAAGWMGRVAGFEVDASHVPDFFQATDVPDFLVGKSSVTTVMVNGLVRVPIGGTRVQPYGAAGVGWLRSRIGDQDSFVRSSNNHAGVNVGGGVVVRPIERIGVRGDVRYFRDFKELQGQSEFFNFGNDKLDFWRTTVGVVFRF